MPKNKKAKIVIICVIAVVVIAAGVTVYLIYSHSKVNNRAFMRRGNFTFNNETLTQAISYLNSADAQSAISYCNRTTLFYCRYYCEKINSSNPVCSQLPIPPFNYTRGQT